jgi:hypothetical protein
MKSKGVSTAGVTKSAPSTNPAGNGVVTEVMMVSSPLLPVKADAPVAPTSTRFSAQPGEPTFFGQIGAELHY